MGFGQALAVAVVLVFLVLGALYVAARNYGEDPDAPQPIWWRVVRGSTTIAMVLFYVYVGTLVLANGAPNYFLGAGGAVFCYGEAISVSGGRKFRAWIVRLRFFTFALMASLYAVGAALEGGPIGILGAILSVLMAAFWWWVVVKTPWTDPVSSVQS